MKFELQPSRMDWDSWQFVLLLTLTWQMRLVSFIMELNTPSWVRDTEGGYGGRWNSCRSICYPCENGSQKVSDDMYELQTDCCFIVILKISSKNEREREKEMKEGIKKIKEKRGEKWLFWLTLPWRKKWQPTPVLLPGKYHGQRSEVGYSPWGRKESDTTE